MIETDFGQVPHVVSTTCWNSREKDIGLQTVPPGKTEELQLEEEIRSLIRVKSLEESGLLPGMTSLILKRSLESPSSTTLPPSAGPRWLKLLLNLWTLNQQLAWHH